MKVTIKKWKAVAAWKWEVGSVGDDETCGICYYAFDGCCPDCKVPGDDCPLVKSTLEKSVRWTEGHGGFALDRMIQISVMKTDQHFAPDEPFKHDSMLEFALVLIEVAAGLQQSKRVFSLIASYTTDLAKYVLVVHTRPKGTSVLSRGLRVWILQSRHLSNGHATAVASQPDRVSLMLMNGAMAELAGTGSMQLLKE
ncbi:ubiquitin-protein ligase Anaphase Promoting Complex [Geranomyces variabilis]|uniref:Ubiquitin-protein ligase Anaphase Promoting Complex n=1 Tax=Geranomyces variabilis TaxID=109894 RepID=A0AAD5TIE4_9FUNG|nr:ubiquitin-protein ligase Anaphase Promoting Complex [Geranomyces variabilis]